MSDKKIIAIAGATGQQGGALLRAILAEGANSQFIARAITRDANSEKSQALKKQGAEVVQVTDALDENALAEAIKGSYGFFCVTALDFHQPESEIKQAQAQANAAKKVGIKHVVWSTLEDSRKLVPLESTSMPTLFGKYKVPHFDVKAEADQCFADLPTTYLLTSCFFDNFLGSMGPKPGQDGKLYLNLPIGQRPMAGIATEDIGKTALGIFKHPEYINKRAAAGEILTGAGYAAAFAKVSGKEVGFNAVPFDAFRKFGFPGAEELGNMFQYFHDTEAEFSKARSNFAETKKLNPELMTFEQFLTKHKAELKF